MLNQTNKNRIAREIKKSFILIFQVLPLILCGIIMSAAIASLLPAEVVMKYVGSEVGVMGIIVGSMAGVFVPGEPFLTLPIAQGLAKAGAGYGALVAFVSSWALFSVTLYPTEIAFLGLRFVVLRSIINLFIPGLAGLIACILTGLLQ